ncbi:hypothetical protein PF005_g30774 [Phytophthora fragariae]|uniref:Uncharacterized protein n=2 Tax=Phytophthora fragariae TaxID=53985 RepID=A0A6A3PT12_9STRA|nr:hypothetical protein PF010_g29237 [Phytophthora fragariae]KAE9062954.1 hypothetical protein PF006_g31056 [Phytophthora fragariae]KAE9162646.1 hypothetical protein PF005_g30774 [Phytophthora fragariae]KAE9336304.1 hypothetical protein PF008_g13086 [Phytophthora fragariae]
MESDSSDKPERILRRLLDDYECILTRPLRENETEADRQRVLIQARAELVRGKHFRDNVEANNKTRKKNTRRSLRSTATSFPRPCIGCLWTR